MCTKSSCERSKSGRRFSAEGRSAVFVNSSFDWSNSFFEIQKMRKDEDTVASKWDERKQILERLNLRKEKLLREKAHVKELHSTHNVFLQTKDVERLVKKAEREMKEVLLMEAERQRLTQEFGQLQKRKCELQLQVLSHSVYHCFLQQVVRLSKFDKVPELVDHLESLLHFRDQLSQRESNDQDRVNRLRTELVTLEDKSQLIMVHKSNQLSHLQTELESTWSEAFLWEQKWNHIEETAAKKTLLLGKIKMGTLNLYEMTGSGLDTGGQSVDVNDTETQLDKIREFIQDHCDIVKRYTSSKEQNNKEQKEGKKTQLMLYQVK